MRLKEFRALVHAALQGNECLLGEIGCVAPPSMSVWREGSMVGLVTMRPAFQGQDGMRAVLEMGTLAAAACADEVVLTWEGADLAVLCGDRAADGSCVVHVCWATSAAHTLSLFPFDFIVSESRTGCLIRPIWGQAIWRQKSPFLPPLIVRLLALCWQRFEGPGCHEDAAAADLRRLGHHVDLCA